MKTLIPTYYYQDYEISLFSFLSVLKTLYLFMVEAKAEKVHYNQHKDLIPTCTTTELLYWNIEF